MCANLIRYLVLKTSLNNAGIYTYHYRHCFIIISYRSYGQNYIVAVSYYICTIYL